VQRDHRNPSAPRRGPNGAATVGAPTLPTVPRPAIKVSDTEGDLLRAEIAELKRRVEFFRASHIRLSEYIRFLGQQRMAWHLGISPVKWHRQTTDEARTVLLSKARSCVRKHKRRKPNREKRTSK
jgi:hypothetical protein